MIVEQAKTHKGCANWRRRITAD